MMIVKSLTPGKGVPAKETPRSSQYIDHRRDPCGCKVESKRLRNKRRCYRDWSLWCGGGYRQDELGTTAVYATQESGESLQLGGGDVESQVGADRKRTR